MQNNVKFFTHSEEWAEIVYDCYGFTPKFIVLDQENYLPLFLSNSLLFGRKMVSAIYNFYASPIYQNEYKLRELLVAAINLAKNEKANFLQIKPVSELPESVVNELGFIKKNQYKITQLELDSYDVVYKRYKKNFRQNIRTNLRKLKDNKIFIEKSLNYSDLRAFYSIMVRLYRDKHLMIAQPFRLFKLIFKELIIKNKADLWIARLNNGRVIGGILTILENDIVTYAWSATDQNFAIYSINSLIVNEAIKYYCNHNFKLFDFGISSPYQNNLLFFKSRWGGKTWDLPYYYYLIKTKEIPNIDFHKSYVSLRKLFRYVPIWTIEALSPFIVKQLN
ncbi:MAG: GNAT family N-acetyltransferase [Methanosarcinales archaeon]